MKLMLNLNLKIFLENPFYRSGKTCFRCLYETTPNDHLRLLIKYSSWQYLKKTWKGTLRKTVIWKSVVILHLDKQRELITRFKLKQVYRGNDSTELWSLAILLKKQFPTGSPFEGSYLCFHKEPESLLSGCTLLRLLE